MDERLRFIARLLDGEKMAGLCREFGISRKTGYKILTRYNEIGLEGLTDRSRRPYRHANQLPFQIEAQIVRLKQDKPSWGAPKIRELLARYRRYGPEGLRRAGRPRQTEAKLEPVVKAEDLATARQRLGELERKIGQQQVELDFFRRALRRVGEARQPSDEPGVKASTPS
jgi:transposase